MILFLYFIWNMLFSEGILLVEIFKIQMVFEEKNFVNMILNMISQVYVQGLGFKVIFYVKLVYFRNFFYFERVWSVIDFGIFIIYGFYGSDYGVYIMIINRMGIINVVLSGDNKSVFWSRFLYVVNFFGNFIVWNFIFGNSI